MNGDPTSFIVMMVVLIFGISFHEFAHAAMANAAGDDTPRLDHRLTLNPLAHLDPLGTMMMVISAWSGFGIGWGKPVRVNPSRMRNPRWDHFASVVAGPMSNLIQALLYAIALRLWMHSENYDFGWLRESMAGGSFPPITLLSSVIADLHSKGALPFFLIMGAVINVSLAVFNLIPLGPLDGHWMLGTFLPERSRIAWYMWNRQIGSFAFLGLLLIGQFDPRLSLFSAILGPATWSVTKFLVGI